MWNSTKERTKLGKINRMEIHGKSLQRSNETRALKGEMCVCRSISFPLTVYVCGWVCVCMHAVWVRMCVCICVEAFLWLCVCIEGSVNSNGCVGAVFSVLLSVATAKWLDKNQKDLSHSSICIQEEKDWMLSSVGWGHDLRWREQKKKKKKRIKGRIKGWERWSKNHKRWRDQRAN